MTKKIKQIIVADNSVYIFTENPEQDIKEYINAFEDEDYSGKLEVGYELPVIYEFLFLGNKYPCISLWFDNEDIPDCYNNFKNA